MSDKRSLADELASLAMAEGYVAELRVRVGAAIRRARTARGWSLRQLAVLAGDDHANVAKVERGELYIAPTAERCARVLCAAAPAPEGRADA